MTKTSIMTVQGIDIALTTINDEDFICITDIVKAKAGDNRAADVIKNWIRSRTTIEFLGTWETLYNPNFKVVEFDHFRKEASSPCPGTLNACCQKRTTTSRQTLDPASYRQGTAYRPDSKKLRTEFC